MNNINWEFVKAFDEVIGVCSENDMIEAMKRKKIKLASKLKGYTLSKNTEYLIETKNEYLKGKISEEEAKSIYLHQRLDGNLLSLI